MSWKCYIQIPDGYRKLQYGEPMRSDDLIYMWNDDCTCQSWQIMGECEETKVEYPYNESYKPMVRKND